MINIFDKIESEESAYIAGFLAADGTIALNSNQIRIELKNDTSEVKLLKRIYKELNLTTKFTFPKNKNSCLIYFNDLNIKQSLSKLHIIPKKTYTVKVPDIDSNYMRHYLRGYFDGDGWITYSKPYNNSYISSGLIGNKLYVNQINNILKENISLKLSITKNKTMYQLACSGCYKTFKFLNYLYKDSSIYLERKYTLYKNLETFIKNKDSEKESLSLLQCPNCLHQGLKKHGNKKLKSGIVKRYKCSLCNKSTIHPI